MLTAEEVIGLLDLKPLPIEGGAFRETYRSPEEVAVGRGRTRSLSTAIYYLLREDEVSTLHRLPSDELFHFYAGDPVEMLLLAGGEGCAVTLGGDLAGGARPQVLVPRGVWQGCRLLPGGRWALMGTTVSPGFDYEDFELGDGEDLAARYPAFATVIRALAPSP